MSNACLNTESPICLKHVSVGYWLLVTVITAATLWNMTDVLVIPLSVTILSQEPVPVPKVKYKNKMINNVCCSVCAA